MAAITVGWVKPDGEETPTQEAPVEAEEIVEEKPKKAKKK